MGNNRRRAPAAERNRAPIAEVLAPYLERSAFVLEVASGTGQHALYMTNRFPQVTWQPSDVDPDCLASIRSWREDCVGGNLLPPLCLDCTAEEPWPLSRPVDLLVGINLIHISPWSACEGLFRQGQQLIREGGYLYFYGAFFRKGHEPAQSNRNFDAGLRARNPSWGVRQLESVVELAERDSFTLDRVVAMPANNLSVFFKRTAG